MAEETVTNLQEPASDSPSMVLMVAAQHEACQRHVGCSLDMAASQMQSMEHSGAPSVKHCEQPAPGGLRPVAAPGGARRWAAGQVHTHWQDSLWTARTQRASGGRSET